MNENALKETLDIITATEEKPRRLRRNRNKEQATQTIKVIVTIPNLNIRTGAGKNCDKIGQFAPEGIVELSEIRDGEGSDNGWGKLATGEGWISLDFCANAYNV